MEQLCHRLRHVLTKENHRPESRGHHCLDCGREGNARKRARAKLPPWERVADKERFELNEFLFRLDRRLDSQGDWNGTPHRLWTGSQTSTGYGAVGLPGHRMKAVHIVTWTLAKGPVPEGLELDHLCRVRLCAEVTHLEAVTHQVNVMRGDRAKPRTHCPHGHEYTPENTVKYPYATECRTCQKSRGLAAKARKRERLIESGLRKTA